MEFAPPARHDEQQPGTVLESLQKLPGRQVRLVEDASHGAAGNWTGRTVRHNHRAYSLFPKDEMTSARASLLEAMAEQPSFDLGKRERRGNHFNGQSPA